MVATESLAFVRANLPAPPMRLLEIGAGDGALARALADGGYEVLAIDPEPIGAEVRPVALHELDEPAASFDAAVAVTSLHHVEPLEDSLEAAELLKPGGALVVDEFDVAAFDERAAAWWLRQRHALGAASTQAPGSSSASIARTSTRSSGSSPRSSRTSMSAPRSTAPTCTAGTSMRPSATTKKTLIARAEIPAVGARLLAQRHL